MAIVVPGAPFPVIMADSGAVSAFSRLNVSQNMSIFSNVQQYGDNTTVWESAYVGTGAITFLPNESTIQMTTGGTGSTASCIRQSRLYHRYTPGHGLTTIQTFVFDGGISVTNNTRRVGYFDSNNGIYLEAVNGTVNLVLRSYTTGAVVETRVAQSSWNVDKFDGTGPSGITINWVDAQILIIDLQWLGVGRDRIGFDINGSIYWAHYFQNANAKTTVYMTTANLPLRYENFNTGTAGGTYTLRHICSNVNTDGGTESLYGHQYSANNNAVGAGGLAVTSGATKPLISIQANTVFGSGSVRNTGQIIVQSYTTVNNALNSAFWQLILNGTLTGASFASFGTMSVANVDTTATAITGGIVLDSGYISSSASNKGTTQQTAADIKQMVLAYSGLLNHQDTITLVATAVGGAATVWGGFTWLEEW